MNILGNSEGWHLAGIDTFWNKIAFQKKVYHVYEDEDTFVGILAGFVGTGINANECTVVIASAGRLEKLKAKLRSHGLQVESLIEDDRFVPVSAESVLNRFMVDGFPDEDMFISSISGILSRQRKKNRNIRTYREMSSILLQQGNTDASFQLELLWRKYGDKEKLSLFCAYPGSVADVCTSLKMIGIYNCKVVSNTDSVSKIFYRDCVESV